MSLIPKKKFYKIQHPDFLNNFPDKIIQDNWKFKEIYTRTERQDFYDTFEWQAFVKGIIIVKKRNALFLLDDKTGHTRASVMSPVRQSYFFSDDFPSNKVCELLSSCTDIRAFIKLASFDVKVQAFHIYDINDGNEKIIGILIKESIEHSEKHKHNPPVHIISLQPFRGYKEESENIENSLTENSEKLKAIDLKNFFIDLMSYAGLNVQGYSSKLHLNLDPNTSIYESAQKVLRYTLSIMRVNEAGIRKNIDTEFLHDYRVAVRRTRSILKQLKGIFEPEATAYFLDAFRDIGRQTNEIRDNDVYLLDKVNYCNCLPASFQPSLHEFFNEIAASRKAVHKEFSRYLVSAEYLSLIRQWEEFINQPVPEDSERTPNASHPTSSIALKSIRKAWKKVIRNGRQISRESTDAELHSIRIDCKKLRYLLEFFASIFPHDTIDSVVSQLKKLQDNLGNFIDVSIQLDYLQHYLASIEIRKKNKLLIASIGSLITIIYQKKEKARFHFHETFREFDNDDTERRFQDLLSASH
ncbi:MAG: CHAD domain-containing protein [Chlorobium sp.]|nr:MAG: CHAD domain-containing protein [Chlorobium sp.]